jgi:hypothetical protein
LANLTPTPDDIATLRQVAREYRELADRMEPVIASDGVAENRATKWRLVQKDNSALLAKAAVIPATPIGG